MSEVPTPWLCLQQDLRQNGIDPDRLERTVNRTMAGNFEALRNRELDVVQMFEPYVSMALQAGIGKILHAASTRGPTVYTTFLATRDSIERNRTSFAAMIRAVRHMQSWLCEHSAEELADVRTVLSGRGARPAGELASALSRCGPLVPAHRSVAGGIRTVGRMPPVRRFYLRRARLRGLCGSKPVLNRHDLASAFSALGRWTGKAGNHGREAATTGRETVPKTQV